MVHAILFAPIEWSLIHRVRRSLDHNKWPSSVLVVNDRKRSQTSSRSSLLREAHSEVKSIDFVVFLIFPSNPPTFLSSF